ncbi:MAG: GNAT family N-acetyltransferase [Saprospirales bacterium]|nr:GNAT family N-acetyltransferase [Saprospirales bacterium]
MKPLDTPRLHLRPFTEQDAAFMLELLNSPTWLRYIGDRGVHTISEARAYLTDRVMKDYDELKFGMYLLELKEEGIPVGTCGLIKRIGLPEVDLGFALHPDFEGKGYGFESAYAVLNHAFTELGMNRLIAITVAYNTRSIHLLEKLGFTLEGKTQLPDDEEELLVYGIDRQPE